MHAPIRPLQGKWPAALEQRAGRFFWVDPRVVLADGASPESFRRAMAAFDVGQTMKITGQKRHGAGDSMLVEHVDLTDAELVDIGASDGTTSLELIERLPDFRSYVIADLFLKITARQLGKRTLFFDPDGKCILVVGPRAAAWPARSRAVEALVRPLVTRAQRTSPSRDVLLLNPEVRTLMTSDSRVTFAVHDIFEPWPGSTPDVIKVANLLRRMYFSDEQISAALQAIFKSLPDQGHLLLVDNPRIKGIDERAGLYRKDAGGFVAVARTEEIPEIDDLIGAVTAG
jgi:hypothetical protein